MMTDIYEGNEHRATNNTVGCAIQPTAGGFVNNLNPQDFSVDKHIMLFWQRFK
jgi:hypothetical protein